MNRNSCTIPLAFAILFILKSTDSIISAPLNDENKSVHFHASYIGDNINNLSGGIKTGSAYLGAANIRFRFNFEQAGLWKGGFFFIDAANTHGATPSADLIGDAQIISNIEAGNHTYIQEVWYKHAIGHVEITGGLQDLNVEFAFSEQGALFMNSSFGILPVISGNFAAPIFPLTAVGLTVKWKTSPHLSWVNAVYDGSPTNFDYNPYNLNWQFNSGDGLLLISEIQNRVKIKSMKGVYKLGIYSHFHRNNKKLASLPDSLINRLFGVYAYADQNIWEQNQRRLGIFSQLGYSPSEDGVCKFYLGCGITFAGLVNKKGNDVFGLSFAHALYKPENRNETAVELTWQYLISKNIFVQPDFQYIIHPAGNGNSLQNALAGNLRFGISF